MPTFLEDLDRTCPNLWAGFSAQVEDDASQWSAKLNGAVPCLDRDWRKLVFTLFDYAVVCLGLMKRSLRPDGRRLDTIVHPVSQ